MATVGLAITVALALAAGVLYLSNGVAILRRRRNPPWPMLGFAIGWLALGVALAADAAQFALGLAPEPSVAAHWVFVWLRILAFGVAVGGFGVYILYAWTGSMRIAAIGLAVGALQALWWLQFANRFTIDAIIVGQWGTRPAFTPDIQVLGGTGVVVFVFLLPLLELIIGYIVFWPAAKGPGQQFRLSMVSGALMLFLATAWLQSDPGIDPDTPILALNMMAAIAGGLLARLGFTPPAWMRRRYGLVTYPA